MKGNQIVNMFPNKNGQANQGHACVKGRFAWGYATHPDRLTKPMIREQITDPWQEATWEEAINFAASRFKAIQAKYGMDAIGGLVSSRCPNEEDYLVQKLVRAAFGNNNVDTCARVCHSPTGYGLSATFGTSAGTQTFESVTEADVIMVIGVNPTDGHPLVGSQLKKRLREGAQLIVVDPRDIDLANSPHIKARHHLKLRPGTNVVMINSLAHLIVSEDLVDEAFVAERCDPKEFQHWKNFVLESRNSPEEMEAITGVPAIEVRAAARLYASAGNSVIYYGLGVTEHSQGATMVIGIANLAMATGNVGRPGCRGKSLAGSEQRARLLRHECLSP